MSKGIELPKNKKESLAWLRNFLSSLVKKGKVAGVVGLRRSSDHSASYQFATTPGEIGKLNPWLPDFPINGAKLAKDLTFIASPSRPVIFILRPCELRATVELVKLNQVQPDNLIFISYDCAGALDFPYLEENGIDTDIASEGLRRACLMCEDFIPTELCDIRITSLAKTPSIIALTPKGEELLSETGEAFKDIPKPDYTSISEERKKNKKAEWDEFDRLYKGKENFFSAFADCINCHNCKDACPICFCQECFFESAALQYEGDKFVNLGKRFGSMKLPLDTILFHLGRLNHMVVACVGCGACEDACPRNIPVSLLFKRVGENVQAIFNYKPGRSLKEEIPLKEFKEDELSPK